MSLPTDPRRPLDEQPAASAVPDEYVEQELTPESEVLQQVLNQTLAGMMSTRELSPKVYISLLEVARAHAGEPLSLDPVAIKLVEASLRVQFPALVSREALSRRMCLWVAESLLADPAARQRMTELWARLGEALA